MTREQVQSEYKRILSKIRELDLQTHRINAKRDNLYKRWRILQTKCKHPVNDDGFAYASCVDCGEFDV